MRVSWPPFFLMTISLGLSPIYASGAGPTTPNGAEIIAEACEGLGDRVQLARVRGLTIDADLRYPDETHVELNLDINLPDKMVRTETIHFGGEGPTVSRVVSLAGNTASVKPGTVGVPLQVDTGPRDAEALARQLQAELTRYAVIFLCTTNPSLAFQTTYAGRAEAPDGTAVAVDVADQRGAVGRLFLAEKTYRPLMLSYQGIARRAGSRTEVRGDSDQWRKDRSPKTETVEMHLGDYRLVNGLLAPGLLAPHHISVSAGGEVTEEWTVRRIRFIGEK